MDRSDDIDQRIEAQEQMIRDQQKAINDLKLILLKVVENTQKIADDKAKISLESPPKTNEEIKQEKAYLIHEGDDKYSFYNPQGEKIEKLQSQLDALMHKKELKESGVLRPYPPELDLTPYPEKYKPLKLEPYDEKGSPSQHIYYFLL